MLNVDLKDTASAGLKPGLVSGSGIGEMAAAAHSRIQTLELYFSRHPLGRVALHLGCICRGGKIRFHLAGVRRELRVFQSGGPSSN